MWGKVLERTARRRHKALRRNPNFREGGSLSRSTTTQENQSPRNVSPASTPDGILRRPEASVSPENGIAAASETPLKAAIRKGKEQGRQALYFGFWDRPGHFLYFPTGRRIYDARRDLPGFPWSDALLDGGLLKNGRRPDVCDGNVFWTCGGLSFWYAFYWWDRSGDSRGASNSGIYVRGFGWPEAEEAFAYGCGQFSHIVARQKHPLRLMERPV
ncbi:hypothetical protein [Novosphingobium sp.]|uniref:hypothetical protein n=1 Tax=Novosphingobium sp. TaxID=1874826 RepID=UPI002612DE5C|nr:hypothetical protein [Novosphingobium sp.]